MKRCHGRVSRRKKVKEGLGVKEDLSLLSRETAMDGLCKLTLIPCAVQ